MCIHHTVYMFAANKSTSSSSTGGSNGATSGGQMVGGMPNLGGLFAGGMPKLRSTGNKLIPVRGDNEQESTLHNGSSNRNSNGFNNNQLSSQQLKASLEQQFARAAPSPPTSQSSNTRPQKFNTINVSKMRQQPPPAPTSTFPSDLTTPPKGPAPSVPNNNCNPKISPPLPSKPPSVHRSNSQSNKSRPHLSVAPARPTQPPPSKPPPPPKQPPPQSNGNDSWARSDCKFRVPGDVIACH